MLDLGQTYHATLNVTDANGAPANPVSATLTITLPDGSAVTPAVTLPPAVMGLLAVDYPTVQAGLHKAAWVTTTPGTAATDYFPVRNFISIISLADAKAHLNITRPSADFDGELRRFMMATTELIESMGGICVRRAFTSRLNDPDGSAVLILPRLPVLSVASVTSAVPGTSSWATADLLVDAEAGLVTRADSGTFWGGPWDSAYTCGRQQVPEHFLHAAKEQLRHLWETQRGSQAPAILAGEEIYTATTGWSFTVPRRVLELMQKDMVPVI